MNSAPVLRWRSGGSQGASPEKTSMIFPLKYRHAERTATRWRAGNGFSHLSNVINITFCCAISFFRRFAGLGSELCLVSAHLVTILTPLSTKKVFANNVNRTEGNTLCATSVSALCLGVLPATAQRGMTLFISVFASLRLYHPGLKFSPSGQCPAGLCILNPLQPVDDPS